MSANATSRFSATPSGYFAPTDDGRTSNIQHNEKDFTKEQLQEWVSKIPQLPIMPNKKLPICMIGGGNITQVGHLPAYKQAGFDVIGVFDVNPKNAAETAKVFDIPSIYSNLSEMIQANQSAERRVVYDIAVPACAILKILQELPNDSIVLIQKPLGETLADAAAIRQICKEKSIIGAMNFQLRTAPYIIATKALIAQGIIGDITSVDFRINVLTPWNKWPFFQGIPRMEPIYHSIHYIDLMRDLLGNPSHLHAITYKSIESPDLASVRSNYLFMYNSNSLLQATIHTNHSHRWGLKNAESYLKIEGTKGCVKVGMGMNLVYPTRDLDFLEVVTDTTNNEWLQIPITGSWMWEAFMGPMANLQRYVEGSLDILPTELGDAYQTMALIEAAYKSMEKSLTPISYS